MNHQAFAEAYAAGKSIAESARLAGSKAKGTTALSTIGGRLLKKVEVQRLVEEARAKSSSSRIAEATELKELMTEIVRGEATARVLVNGIPVELTPTIPERLKAAELLGKCHGMFIEKTQNDHRLEIIVRRGADAPAALQAPTKEDDE